ncbi:unnamed protein product [Staurois parvus]|uniref:CRIB domain-containing protein n=1 Tax=Staurois parvus TaxID=386267 RepID=A0ABN9AEF5_9NEOB|nr:unnamed protein product [Staurois parvus]
MIGEPMNFVHLTHIGSGDMASGDGLQMVGGTSRHWIYTSGSSFWTPLQQSLYTTSPFINMGEPLK